MWVAPNSFDPECVEGPYLITVSVGVPLGVYIDGGVKVSVARSLGVYIDAEAEATAGG